VAEVLEQAEGLAAYELNISCPNTARGGMQFGGTPESAAEVVAAVRRVSRRPLWVKLSPLVTDIAAIARALEAAGADALTVANTYPAVSVDIQTRRSRVGNMTGGLSGPAIKPITQRQVLEVAKAVSLPILGLGGIETVVDVVEYIILGATAVQVGTANFVDPGTSTTLVRKLTDLLVQLNVNSLNELHGSFDTDLIAKRGPAGV
jgi:dihydroorotate dehydrogenase (NAD+) catalytic subunit